jgi:poly(3-hydroxyalkanoate) depolymerase
VNLEYATTIRVGRARLRVVVRPGDPGLPALALCNGIGAPHDALEPFVMALDPSITAVRFDLPGVGASPRLRIPVPFAVLARLVADLMRHLGYDRFDVLGISWGGGLAQQIAFQYPRRCRRVVLAATATGFLMVPASPRVLRHMVTPRRYRDPSYALHVAGHLYGGSVRRHPEVAEKLLVASDRPPSRTGYLFQLCAGLGWTSLPFLPLVRQRVLVLAGTDDPIIPLVNAHIMKGLLPHARLHPYDDGHLAIVTNAHDLAPVVSEFVLAP